MLFCPRCGSGNINVQVTQQQKKRGCFASVLWILAAILTVGIILLIPLLTKKGSKAVTHAVCQNCGNCWQLK